nr:DUF4831 family protein [Bacteroidales bacterium]
MRVLFTPFIIAALLLTSGCVPAKTGSKSDIVILPLGGEVKVTDGSIVYALPLTVLEFDIITERTIEIPGPYSEFAKEMIGLEDVIADENEIWSLRDVTLRTVEELDPSQYYVIQGTTLMQTNLLSLKNLQENLSAYKKSIFKVPLVLQYNKRDLEEEGIPILSVDTLERDLNSRLKAPSFPASAVKGDNVAATMKKIIALT